MGNGLALPLYTCADFHIRPEMGSEGFHDNSWNCLKHWLIGGQRHIKLLQHDGDSSHDFDAIPLP